MNHLKATCTCISVVVALSFSRVLVFLSRFKLNLALEYNLGLVCLSSICIKMLYRKGARS